MFWENLWSFIVPEMSGQLWVKTVHSHNLFKLLDRNTLSQEHSVFINLQSFNKTVYIHAGDSRYCWRFLDPSLSLSFGYCMCADSVHVYVGFFSGFTGFLSASKKNANMGISCAKLPRHGALWWTGTQSRVCVL